jgi:hypothetical protein
LIQWFIATYPTFNQDPDQAVRDRIACILGNPVDNYQIDLSYLRLQPTLGNFSENEVVTW